MSYKKNYSEKLRDPRWQKLRLEVMQRDNFCCQDCGNNEATLNVHHFEYHGDPWDTPTDFLITLCENCHKVEGLHRERVEKELLTALRKKRLPWHAVSSLAEGFNGLKIIHGTEVMASIISDFLQNDIKMSKIVEDFFKFEDEDKPF